jgi:hypothetical protein
VGEQPPWNPYGQPDPNQWQGRTYPGRPPYPPQQPYEQQRPYQGQPPFPGQPYEAPRQGGQSDGQQPRLPSRYRGRPARKSWPRRHKGLTVLGGCVALILIGTIAAAAGHQTSPSASTSGAAAAASSAAASSPATIRASNSSVTGTSTDALTGFGATVSAWNAHHTADKRFAPNAAYDPDPALPSYSGQDVYVAVQWQDGRALNYEMNIPGQPIRDAIARALQELPPDARELWGLKRETCYQAELSSPTLGRALSAAAIGDPEGQVFVEFDTVLPDGSSVYESTSVNEILVGLGSWPTAASAPAC